MLEIGLSQLAKGIQPPPEDKSYPVKGIQLIPEMVIDHCLACHSGHDKSNLVPKYTSQISPSSRKLVEWSGGQENACFTQADINSLRQGIRVKPMLESSLSQLAKGIQPPPEGKLYPVKGITPIPEIVIDHCLACHSGHDKIDEMHGPPHIPVNINRIIIMAIVDTGADRTLCQSQIAEKIYGCRWKQHLKTSTVRLKSATGHALKVRGEIDMVMGIGELKVKHSVVVVDDAIAPFLIGQDFMLDKVILEDGRYFILHDDDQGVIKIPIIYNTKEFRVKTVQNERIPPLSSRLIRGIIKAKSNQSEDEQDSFDDLI